MMILFLLMTFLLLNPNYHATRAAVLDRFRARPY